MRHAIASGLALVAALSLSGAPGDAQEAGEPKKVPRQTDNVIRGDDARAGPRTRPPGAQAVPPRRPPYAQPSAHSPSADEPGRLAELLFDGSEPPLREADAGGSGHFDMKPSDRP